MSIGLGHGPGLGGHGPERFAERRPGAGRERGAAGPAPRLRFSQAWRDASELVRQHRGRLALGFALMLVNRAAGFVLPAAPKFVIDDAIQGHRPELLPLIALALAAAMLVQAGTSFVLSQLLGVAAQRAITEMRKRVMAHVTRLPVRYFDTTQTGVLISRVMTDAEGVRNLVGTGLVQLASSVVTAVAALAWLFVISWQLTLLNLVLLGVLRRAHDVRVRPAAAAVPRARPASTPRSPAGWARRWAACAWSRPTPPSGASSSSSRAARTGCSATSPAP